MNSTLPVESTGGRTAWETAARLFFFHFTDTVIFLALEVRQLHGLAVVVAPHEVGRLVSGIEHELSFKKQDSHTKPSGQMRLGEATGRHGRCEHWAGAPPKACLLAARRRTSTHASDHHQSTGPTRPFR